jgi:hypothetical protein
MQYRKKPVVIDAIELKFSTESQDEIIQWSNNTIQKGLDGGLRIPTLEGIMVANTGDYIIRGVKGEYYPCKPDIFEMTYELASTLPQQEISDEEIEKWGKEYTCKEYGKLIFDYENYDEYRDFVNGAKKYREQLKFKQPKKD